jgi:hypothetical protein
MFISLEDCKSKHGFFLCLFRGTRPKGKFVLSPTSKVVGYFSLRKNITRKSVGIIKKQKKIIKEKYKGKRRSLWFKLVCTNDSLIRGSHFEMSLIQFDILLFF